MIVIESFFFFAVVVCHLFSDILALCIIFLLLVVLLMNTTRRSATPNKATNTSTSTSPSNGLSAGPPLYEGENVVLTGSTGFVGLRTLKTLLTHTEVDNIILPIRVKGELRNGEEAVIIRFSSILSKYGEGLDLSIDDPGYLSDLR
jgi:hypothetical protein